MNHLSEFSILELYIFSIERLQRNQRTFPPKFLLGINVLILTVALGTMRHEADLVRIFTPRFC